MGMSGPSLPTESTNPMMHGYLNVTSVWTKFTWSTNPLQMNKGHKEHQRHYTNSFHAHVQGRAISLSICQYVTTKTARPGDSEVKVYYSTSTAIVNKSLSGFDITTVVVVGHEYDYQLLKVHTVWLHCPSPNNHYPQWELLVHGVATTWWCHSRKKWSTKTLCALHYLRLLHAS